MLCSLTNAGYATLFYIFSELVVRELLEFIIIQLPFSSLSYYLNVSDTYITATATTTTMHTATHTQ
jgi:hypothetical protein